MKANHISAHAAVAYMKLCAETETIELELMPGELVW